MVFHCLFPLILENVRDGHIKTAPHSRTHELTGILHQSLDSQLRIQEKPLDSIELGEALAWYILSSKTCFRFKLFKVPILLLLHVAIPRRPLYFHRHSHHIIRSLSSYKQDDGGQSPW